MHKIANSLPRIFVGRSLLAALVLVLVGAGMAPAKQAVIWQLTNFQVVDAGETTESPEGLLTTGYVVEADATSAGGSFATGKFQLTLSAFSPFQKMAGQQPGFCYVQGVWSITDVTAGPELTKARHSKAVIKGGLNTQLAFNPTADPGEFSAQVRVPTSPFWGRGEGSFSGDLENQALLYLALIRPGKAK